MHIVENEQNPKTSYFDVEGSYPEPEELKLLMKAVKDDDKETFKEILKRIREKNATSKG